MPDGASRDPLAVPHPQGGDPVHVTVPEGATAGYHPNRSRIAIKASKSDGDWHGKWKSLSANQCLRKISCRPWRRVWISVQSAGSQDSRVSETPALPDVLPVRISHHLHCDSSTSAVAFEYVVYRSRLRLRLHQRQVSAGFHQHSVRQVALVLLYWMRFVGQKSPLNPHGDDNSEIAWYDLPYATKGECAKKQTGKGGTCDLGELSRSVPKNLTDWYHGMASHLFEMGSCNEAYTRFLSQHADVSNAAAWEQEYDPTNSQAGYNPMQQGIGFSFNDCKSRPRARVVLVATRQRQHLRLPSPRGIQVFTVPRAGQWCIVEAYAERSGHTPRTAAYIETVPGCIH